MKTPKEQFEEALLDEKSETDDFESIADNMAIEFAKWYDNRGWEEKIKRSTNDFLQQFKSEFYKTE